MDWGTAGNGEKPEGYIREDLDGLGGDGEYGQHAAGDDITTILNQKGYSEDSH